MWFIPIQFNLFRLNNSISVIVYGYDLIFDNRMCLGVSTIVNGLTLQF